MTSFLKKNTNVDPELDEEGYYIITSKYLQESCYQMGLYETPRLNTKLYLHYKGFRKIEGLEEYVNLGVLWLQNNVISKIENISHLVNLKSLFLNNNMISKIENLSTLKQLGTLNLSHNKIEKIENLEGLIALNNLDISYNCISTKEHLEGMQEAPTIATINLSYNNIMEDEGIIEFFLTQKNLGCMYLKGNEMTRKAKQYRRKLISGLDKLFYLDERPVTEVERIGAEAWLNAGMDMAADRTARQTYYEEKKAKEDERLKISKEEREKQTNRTKIALERIDKKYTEKRDLLEQRRVELREKFEKEGDKDEILLKLKKVEDDLDDIEDTFEIKRKSVRGIASGAGRTTYVDNGIPCPPINNPKIELSDDEKLEEEENPIINTKIHTEENMNIMVEEEISKTYEKSAEIGEHKEEAKGEKEPDWFEGLKEIGEIPDDLFKPKVEFEWNEYYDKELEELLINNTFGFEETYKEFICLPKYLEEFGKYSVINLSPEALQSRYTAIEMKKYREESKKEEENSVEVIKNEVIEEEPVQRVIVGKEEMSKLDELD